MKINLALYQEIYENEDKAAREEGALLSLFYDSNLVTQIDISCIHTILRISASGNTSYFLYNNVKFLALPLFYDSNLVTKIYISCESTGEFLDYHYIAGQCYWQY
ncbi:hypothetical protein NGRA_3405 [Nosema granulosis]|uniref:Uncharacterized protein n=1 Tax=Nosema granulosis TaxID=83296 RepID=A0A9P6GXE4_9MICR|nr:hypothetical protein NGRA_3405 [Nosema granulosis]